jgi:ribonuclease HI
MSAKMPHFLLKAGETTSPGNWRFSLENADGRELEVNDFEPFTQGQRLELLAVVRGLEALEQPSRVTVLTPSSYVKRGIAYGMEDWRASGWCWESHGKMVPVKNSDLWRRLDRALQFHRVECRLQPMMVAGGAQTADNVARKLDVRVPKRWLAAASGRWIREFGAAIRLKVAQFGTGLLPRPWFE